jgi:hypothetical protein
MRATALVALALAALPLTARAQALTCQSVTYCDDALVCGPDDNSLAVRPGQPGEVDISWNGGAAFPARIAQDGATRIYVDTAETGIMFVLMVDSAGKAYAATASDFGDGLESGTYALTCRTGK